MNPIRIRVYNNVHPSGLSLFDDNYMVGGAEIKDPHILLVRSEDLRGVKIPDSVIAIGRAGVGVEKIPFDELAERGVVVFNAPGSNANAVAELVACAWTEAYRNVHAAISFAASIDRSLPSKEFNAAVEDGKKQYVGSEIRGKRFAVFGLGNIGVRVANLALGAGMVPIGHDPFLSLDAAWEINPAVRREDNRERLLGQCDFISINVSLNPQTEGYLGAHEFSLMTPGVVVINYARAELVDTEAMMAALDAGIVRHYACDFPDPVWDNYRDKVTTTPHLGASTNESEEECAVQVVTQVRDYVELGSIKHAVNFPSVKQEDKPTAHRLMVFHANQPDMLAKMADVFGRAGVNIGDAQNVNSKPNAIFILDADNELPQGLIEELQATDGVVRVHQIFNH